MAAKLAAVFYGTNYIEKFTQDCAPNAVFVRPT